MCPWVIGKWTITCCGFNHFDLSKDHACSSMCMGSSLSVVRFSELKSVPVVDQEVLVHGGTWLPCSFCSHAHYSHTSATFTSLFFFISYDFCLVLPSDDLANTFILPTEIFKPFVLKVFFFLICVLSTVQWRYNFRNWKYVQTQPSKCYGSSFGVWPLQFHFI